MSTFQNIILNLQKFWCEKGCVLQQSHDLQTGAGTFNPETFLRALGDDPYNVCHVEISRRPTDGRYGENPNRLQRFHQFQVMMKPSPENIQQLYLESLEAIGFDLKDHDIRFVHDDWESPTQGASGLGWEVWCDGMEVTQFTYFQQIGGVELSLVPAEIAYGLERIALFLQKKDNVYDLQYNDTMTYGEVLLEAEKQYSRYNFEEASVDTWQSKFDSCEKESKELVEKGLPIPAYDFAVEASHAFNMLDARGAISTTARVSMIHRVRDLCCSAAECYVESLEKQAGAKKKEPEDEESLVPVKKTSSKAEDFLLEIGTEHLPANAIAAASLSLEKEVKAFFDDRSISYKNLEVFATPKRLAVVVEALSSYTEEVLERRKGPSLAIAFEENGRVTKAGAGFFRSIGVDVSIKEQISVDERFEIENDRLIFLQKHEREFTGKLLQENLKRIILSIRFPKRMKWGAEGVLFSRPIRSLVVMFGKAIIDLEIEGIRSSNKVALNVQQSGKVVQISKPSEYVAKLKKGKVLASVAERKEFIDAQIEKLCDSLDAVTLRRDEVTAEVLYLSEYPVLAVCEFEERFLTLPEELIASEMIDHQKYYPLQQQGVISTKFIVGVDKEPTDAMLKNYEAVLTARLSDGFFLYEKDKKASFAGWNHALNEVVLHPKLGSIYNKVERICALSKQIAGELHLPYEENAALYCKADLVSDVVYEFPELQGVMGKYYAREFGENEAVAVAIEESYFPLSEGSEVPKTPAGMVVALADRIDNLLSYMGIGLVPTSSKDPYALRRSAIGVLRILIENKLSLDLSTVIADKKVQQFITGRLKSLLKEYGFSASDIEMCGIYDLFNPYKIYKCVKAISRIRGEKDEFNRLVEVYKRIKGSASSDYTFNVKDLEQKEEIALYERVQSLEEKYKRLVEEDEFESALASLSELVAPLESFFDNVRVRVDEERLMNNRMALLQIPYSLIATVLHF